MTRRIERVNELVKEVVSGAILKTLQFQGRTMVTITRVAVSPDLHYTNIFVTIFSPSKASIEEAFAELKKATPFIQHKLNRALRMRPVPRIQFLMDEEETRRERVEELLARDRQSQNSANS